MHLREKIVDALVLGIRDWIPSSGDPALSPRKSFVSTDVLIDSLRQSRSDLV